MTYLILLPFLLAFGAANGQTPLASPTPATGVVMDATRKPIAGATVTAVCAGQTAAAPVRTGNDGSFSLPSGTGCEWLAVAEGFQSLRRPAPPAGGAAVEFILQVEARHDLVTVEATAGQLETSVSSTRAATPLQDVPQSITVISHELIREQAMMSMADVVRYVPGITMAQGEGHRDAPVIRGNATTSDFYVNGVRDDVQYLRDLYNVERVEAVKGANAMTFGRGGGGGVINRVMKKPGTSALREISLQGGTFGNKRAAADFGTSWGEKLAGRLNAVYEDSNSFRNYFGLERYGFAPTVLWRPRDATRVTIAYEFFSDQRTVDRGIPSFSGIPAPAHRSTFFGNPEESRADALVHIGSATIEHRWGGIDLRNTTQISDYDKFYANVFAGAVNSSATLVSLSGYENATQRRNVFNQTDVTGVFFTGRVRHTILTGGEFGRQRTNNVRNTAYFNDMATTILVPFENPTDFSPVTFRQSASDADNRPLNRTASVYVQDQAEISRYLQLVGGVRYDYFHLDVLNNRNGSTLGRTDHMVSPRAGLVVKPLTGVSLYGSYSVSYLPGSGDQFASLNVTTQALKPEKFSNYELGAKWDLQRSLNLTAAVYRLDRTNTRSVDPNNPALIVQTGSQRTKGFELGFNGQLRRKWAVNGGYSYQDAYISSPTEAATLGANVPLVPHHSFSLWNSYQILPRWGMGLGLIQQANMFAGIDNRVTLPSFFRADLATYVGITENMRLQANLENVFDREYFPTAHSNNNISPGFARALRIGLVARF